MRRTVVWVLGAALLVVVLAAPADAQVSIAVGVGGPHVSAGVVIGAPPVYAYPAYPPPYYYAYPYPYPYPYYYRYPVYGRVYYGPGRYYSPRAPYYYRGRAPYYNRGRAPAYRGPVYRGKVQISPGSSGRNVRVSPGNSRTVRSARGNRRR